MPDPTPTIELVAEQEDWFERRTKTVVRGLLALLLVVAYLAFQALGVDPAPGMEILVGAGVAYFLGEFKRG